MSPGFWLRVSGLADGFSCNMGFGRRGFASAAHAESMVLSRDMTYLWGFRG